MRKVPSLVLRWGLLLFAFGVFFWGLRTHSQSWYFQDENDHVAVGWAMARFGQRLYRDLTINHQPLPVLAGGLIAQLPYNSLFSLVERLRLAMFLFFLGTGAYAAWRFRWRGTVAAVLLGSLTYWYFGWYVLAESLSAPAVLLIFLFLFEKANHRPLSRLDSVIAGFSLFWMVFTLLPLWIFAGLAGAWLFWRMDSRQRQFLVAGGLLPTLALFAFIPFSSWLTETVLNNIRYVIPFTTPNRYVELMLYPFFHLPHWQSPIGRWYIGSLVLIGAGMFTKQRLKIQGLFLLLWTLNTRTDHADVTFYHGFHLLPFLAGWAAVTAIAAAAFWQERTDWWRWLAPVVMTALLVNNSIWVTEQKDRLSESAIQYGPQQAIANGLNTLKLPGDTLTTGPDGAGYINMLTDLPFGTRQNFHLNWAWRSPELREAFQRQMMEQPPTFLYFQADEASDFYVYLQPILAQQYHRFSRPDGSVTDLYIKKDEIPRRSPQQWEAFGGQYFVQP